MSPITNTPEPPYYAVIFTSCRSQNDQGYAEMSRKMVEYVSKQPGFLGMESTGCDGAGITVSYWRSLEDIQNWKNHLQHLDAQKQGREAWYTAFATRIGKVEKQRFFNTSE